MEFNKVFFYAIIHHNKNSSLYFALFVVEHIRRHSRNNKDVKINFFKTKIHKIIKPRKIIILRWSMKE